MTKIHKRSALLASVMVTSSAAGMVMPLQAKQIDPFIYTYVAYSIGYCRYETGDMGKSESQQWIIRTVKRGGITLSQLKRHLNNPSFQSRAKSYIKREGGCSEVVASFKQPRSGSTQRTGYERGTLSDTPFEF